MVDAVRGGGDLESWLAPFLDVMGRKTRRSWAPLYLRGLLGPWGAQEPAADGHTPGALGT
jgi:hypothetical protein